MEDIRQAINAYSSDPAALLSRSQWIAFCAQEFNIEVNESDRIFSLLDVDNDGFVPIADILKNIADYPSATQESNGLSSHNHVANNSHKSMSLRRSNSRVQQQEIFEASEPMAGIPHESWQHYTTLHRAIHDRDQDLLIHLEKVMEQYSSTLRQLEAENHELHELCAKEKLINQQQRDALAEEFEHQLQQIQKTHSTLEFQRSIERYEERIREDEREKEMLRERMEVMQKTLEQLQRATEYQECDTPKQQVKYRASRDRVKQLAQENSHLHETLKAAQTELALTRSKLASIKAAAQGKDEDLAEERRQFETAMEEMEQKVALLVEANRELSDNNESLWGQVSTPSVPGSRLGSFRANSCSLPLSFELNSAMSRSAASTGAADEALSSGTLSGQESFRSLPRRHSRRKSRPHSERNFKEDDEGSSTEPSSELEMHFSARVVTGEEEENLRIEKKPARSQTLPPPSTTVTIDRHVQSYEPDRPTVPLTMSRDTLDGSSSPPEPRSHSNTNSTPVIPTNMPPLEEVRRHFRVVLLGDTGVGKSSFVIRVCKGFFPSSRTTVGIDFFRKVLRYKDVPYVLEMWDTAGQERFQSVSVSYLRRVDAVVIMYDCTRPNTLVGARVWMSKVESQSEHRVPVLLLGNKIDLRKLYAGSSRPVVDWNDGAALAKEWDMLFHEISAKTEESVSAAVDDLMHELTKSLTVDSDDPILLSRRKRAQMKFKCCSTFSSE